MAAPATQTRSDGGRQVNGEEQGRPYPSPTRLGGSSASMGEGLAQKLAMGTAHSPEQRKQRAGEEESAVSSPAHPPPRAAEPMSPESPALPNFKDAVREALATRRRIVGEEELAKTPNRRDKALKYVLRPYGYKLLVFECIGVLLMLAHGSTTVLWFGEEKAQRVNHKRCVANGMAFRQADDIDVATDPPFFSSPKGVGHAYGMSAREHVRRWRGHRRRERMEACGDGGVGSCDAVLSVMGGVTLELNSATAGLEPKPKLKESEYARLARQAWDNWSKKKRRRLCEPLDTRPKVGRRPACWRYCRLCDYVRTAMEVWDFIAFLLMMRTAYKVETESGGYYEYRPRQIFRYRITRPYFVLQLLIGMPTYSALKLLSGGHLTPISLIQIKAIGRWEKFQRHMRAHLMEYLRIAIKTGVVSNLRALLKLVRSVKWIIDLWNLIFRHVQARPRRACRARAARPRPQRERPSCAPLLRAPPDPPSPRRAADAPHAQDAHPHRVGHREVLLAPPARQQSVQRVGDAAAEAQRRHRHQAEARRAQVDHARHLRHATLHLEGRRRRVRRRGVHPRLDLVALDGGGGGDPAVGLRRAGARRRRRVAVAPGRVRRVRWVRARRVAFGLGRGVAAGFSLCGRSREGDHAVDHRRGRRRRRCDDASRPSEPRGPAAGAEEDHDLR